MHKNLMNHTKKELCELLEKEIKEKEDIHRMLDGYEITRVNLQGDGILLSLYGRVFTFACMLRVVGDRQKEISELIHPYEHEDINALLEQIPPKTLVKFIKSVNAIRAALLNTDAKDEDIAAEFYALNKLSICGYNAGVRQIGQEFPELFREESCPR